MGDHQPTTFRHAPSALAVDGQQFEHAMFQDVTISRAFSHIGADFIRESRWGTSEYLRSARPSAWAKRAQR